MRKKIKNLIVIAIVLVAVVGFAAYMLVFKEAPILHGQTIYNVEYKKDLTLDIYMPINEVYAETPVVVFFHGGAWIAGRKETINIDRYHGAIKTLRTNGYAIVCPEYSLAKRKKSPFPDCIIDAFEAINWVKDHHKEYNFDRTNVGVFGESAGAHIAMMAAYSSPKDFALSQEWIKPNYVVDIYGPNDLKSLHEMQTLDSIKGLLAKLPEPLRNRLDIEQYLFGFDPKTDTIQALSFMKSYSPSSYIQAASVPTLMIHGNADIVVPVEQTLMLQQQFETLGKSFEMHILEGVNHAFIGISPEQYDEVQHWIATFIMSNYHEAI